MLGQQVEKELIATANQKERQEPELLVQQTQIDFEMCFNYDGNEKVGLFPCLSINTNKKMVAIIGQSGSGKTTIADLITLVHRPNREIFINGIFEHIDKKLGGVVMCPGTFILEQSIINNIVLIKIFSKVNI